MASESPLETALSRADHLTNAIADLLDGFDERLATVENAVLPLHDFLQTVRTMHSNMESTHTSISTLLEKLEFAKQLPDQLLKMPLSLNDFQVCTATTPSTTRIASPSLQTSPSTMIALPTPSAMLPNNPSQLKTPIHRDLPLDSPKSPSLASPLFTAPSSPYLLDPERSRRLPLEDVFSSSFSSSSYLCPPPPLSDAAVPLAEFLPLPASCLAYIALVRRACQCMNELMASPLKAAQKAAYDMRMTLQQGISRFENDLLFPLLVRCEPIHERCFTQEERESEDKEEATRVFSSPEKTTSLASCEPSKLVIYWISRHGQISPQRQSHVTSLLVFLHEMEQWHVASSLSEPLFITHFRERYIEHRRALLKDLFDLVMQHVPTLYQSIHQEEEKGEEKVEETVEEEASSLMRQETATKSHDAFSTSYPNDGMMTMTTTPLDALLSVCSLKAEEQQQQLVPQQPSSPSPSSPSNLSQSNLSQSSLLGSSSVSQGLATSRVDRKISMERHHFDTCCHSLMVALHVMRQVLPCEMTLAHALMPTSKDGWHVMDGILEPITRDILWLPGEHVCQWARDRVTAWDTSWCLSLIELNDVVVCWFLPFAILCRYPEDSPPTNDVMYPPSHVIRQWTLFLENTGEAVMTCLFHLLDNDMCSDILSERKLLVEVTTSDMTLDLKSITTPIFKKESSKQGGSSPLMMMDIVQETVSFLCTMAITPWTRSLSQRWLVSPCAQSAFSSFLPLTSSDTSIEMGGSNHGGNSGNSSSANSTNINNSSTNNTTVKKSGLKHVLTRFLGDNKAEKEDTNGKEEATTSVSLVGTTASTTPSSSSGNHRHPVTDYCALIMHRLQSMMETQAALLRKQHVIYAAVFLLNHYAAIQEVFAEKKSSVVVRCMMEAGLGSFLDGSRVERCLEDMLLPWQQLTEGLRKRKGGMVLQEMSASTAASASTAVVSSEEKEALKEMLKTWTGQFQQVWQVARTCYIPKTLLRARLRDRLLEMVLPEYEACVARYKILRGSSRLEKHAPYSPNQVAMLLQSLFDPSL